MNFHEILKIGQISFRGEITMICFVESLVWRMSWVFLGRAQGRIYLFRGGGGGRGAQLTKIFEKPILKRQF